MQFTSERAPYPVAYELIFEVPAMSKWIQFTPFSTNLYKNAAAWLEEAQGFPGALLISACFDFIISWWYSSTGILQASYFTCLPAYKKCWVSSSELLKSPACFLPRAITIAPVSVDNSIIFFTLYFYWVQFMQSASTNRPSASVLPIYTLIPFLDLMISKGRQELALTKFQTHPIDAVRLTFNPNFTTDSKALKTEVAPCLSICISLMPDVGFKLSPPESKQTPFPTKECHSWDSGFPLYERLMNLGVFSLALPTACRRLNLSLISSSPLMM